MMAALQADQGRFRSTWTSVGDIMWSSFNLPKTSWHVFTLSWGMLKTCPVGTGGHKVSVGGGPQPGLIGKMMSSHTYPWEPSPAGSAGNSVPEKIFPLPKC